MHTYHCVETKELLNVHSDVLHIVTKLQETERLGEGEIPYHVPGEILDPGTKVANTICLNKKLVQTPEKMSYCLIHKFFMGGNVAH